MFISIYPFFGNHCFKSDVNKEIQEFGIISLQSFDIK